MKLADLFKQSSIYLVGDVIRRGVGFLMIPIYTRFLAPSDYGIIELIELFVMIAGLCFGMGAVGDGMVRVYHEYQDPTNRKRTVSTAVIGLTVCGIVVASIAALLATNLSSLVFRTTEYTGLIRTAFLAMVFGGLTDLALAYQRLRMRAVMFVTFSSLQVLLNILFNIYFIAFLRMGVWGFILAKLIVTSLGTTYLLAVLFRETGLHFAADAAKRIARFSAPLAVSGAAFFVIHFADRFFLNHYATLSEVGVYALAYKFGFLVTYLVGQPIGSVWNVSLYSHVGAEYWRKNFARIAMYLVFFLLLAAVGLGVFIRETLSVIASPAYAPAALLVPVIAFAYAFREVGDFYRGVLFINKRVALFGRITVSCAVLNLILNWALISQYKALGAAWATLLTWAVYMIACWVLAFREHRIPHSAKSFAIAFGLAVLVCVSAGYLQVLPIGLRWTGSISLVLLFVSSVWGLGYFDVDERKLILRQLAIGRELLVTFAGRARCLLAP